MAVSKVTLDALSQMANILRQSAEVIVSAKGEMDEQLRSFIWDDPVGQAFVVKYEEDFKPLMQKLIPNIESYLFFLQEQGMSISEYAGEIALILGGLSVVPGNAMRRSNNNYEGLNEGRLRNGGKSPGQIINEAKNKKIREGARKVLPFLRTNSSGDILWDNDEFEKLEKEHAVFLNSDSGIKLLGEVLKAFQEENAKHGLNMNSMTYSNLYNIVGKTLGLQDGSNGVIFQKGNRAEEGLLGWHPRRNGKIIRHEAILNEHEENNLSMCQKIATYAHEGRHVWQDIVIVNALSLEHGTKSDFEKKLIEADLSYPIMPIRSQYDDPQKYEESMAIYRKAYNDNLKEVDARKYEIVFGKACVEYYNQTKKYQYK